jgi:hypothetical protein
VDALETSLEELARDLQDALSQYAVAWAEQQTAGRDGVIVDVGPVHAAFSLSVHFAADALRWDDAGGDEASSGEAGAQVIQFEGRIKGRDPTGIQRAVLDVLDERGDACSPQEMGAALAELGFTRSPKSVHSLLSRMVGRGTLVSAGHGKYTLPNRRSPPSRRTGASLTPAR